MKKYYLTTIITLVGFCTLVIACGSGDSRQNQIDNEKANLDSSLLELALLDSSNRHSLNFFEADKQIEAIDKSLGSLSLTLGFMMYPGISDTLRLELYYYQDRPVKLKYTTFDDAGLAAGYGSYYFDNSGYAFANKVSYESMDIIELFLGKHKVMKYRKQGTGTEIMKLNHEAELYRESVAAKKLDDFMMVFKDFNYTAMQPAEESFPIIQTTRELQMYDQPNDASKVVATLPKQTPLKYLGNSRGLSNVGELTWTWYHVVSASGINGWVFGHPEYLAEYNDETAVK